MYSVKEVFLSLQGEGLNSGRPCVFIRFSGCNLWSGREEDRSNAVCKFCDTDFVGSDFGRINATELVSYVDRLITGDSYGFLVVLTGGEPTLQIDEDIVDCLHDCGFEVAIETNGTREVLPSIDWITVSPKLGSELIQVFGNEIKVVYPQDGMNIKDYECLSFDYRYVQPMDGPELERNKLLAVDFCLKNPKWRLSVQSHKILGLR